MGLQINTDTAYGSISPGQGTVGLDVTDYSLSSGGSANLWTPSNYSFAQDDREDAKLAQFQPNTYDSAGNRLLSLAESIATYGLTRAIDNHYGPVETNKTGAPGYYAGANGRTYTTQPSQAGIGSLGSSPWLIPIAIGAVVLLALK